MQVSQSEVLVVVGMEWLVLGGSWGYRTMYKREADGTIIGYVGISSYTMAIGGLSSPPSWRIKEVEDS
jgi:hypothetical protein